MSRTFKCGFFFDFVQLKEKEKANKTKPLYLAAMSQIKEIFLKKLKIFAEGLTEYVSTNSGEWSVKGFIDVKKNIYTISADSKIVSKILEIQLFPKFKEFAKTNGKFLAIKEVVAILQILVAFTLLKIS